VNAYFCTRAEFQAAVLVRDRLQACLGTPNLCQGLGDAVGEALEHAEDWLRLAANDIAPEPEDRFTLSE
jgi:hypothetical protein